MTAFKPVTVFHMGDQPLFLEYRYFDDELEWRPASSEYDKNQCEFLDSLLHESHNDKILDLITEKLESEKT